MQRFELRRHVSRRLPYLRRTGTLDPDREVRISVLLHAKDPHALEDACRQVCDPPSAAYGHYPSALELRSLVAPGYQDLDNVIAWLGEAGLTVDEPTGLRTVVPARGPAERVARAFEVPLGTFVMPPSVLPRFSGERFAAVRNPTIPAALAPVVRGVAGLNDLPAARRPAPPAAPARRGASRAPSPLIGPRGGYTPEAIALAYALPRTPDGSGERVGIVQFGGGFEPRDLEAFCSRFGLAPGTVTETSVSGARNDYRGKTASADVEVALDVDWVRASAPGADIQLYWTPNDDRGWVDLLAALLDRPDAARPGVVSISWGMPEDGYASSRRFDQTRQLFLSAALLGITFVCASGDWGASDEPPGTATFDGSRHVDFPSVMPEVTGVGGTKLLLARGVAAETAWNDGVKGGASGGGFSRFVRVPDWQRKALGKRTGITGRGVPDVAAVASPDPGLSIFVHGAFASAGGTSVAAPLWAGFLARVNEARRAAGRPTLGAANAALYALAASRSSPFRDVDEGGNGFAGVDGFEAARGWDPVTGLGSADVAKLIASL